MIAIAAAGPARAAPAADLLKQGIELYKAGKYADAAAMLSKAYDADPKPEVLFPLAQAERLAGDCEHAAAHYKLLLQQLSDLGVAKLVQQNLSLCEKPTEPTAPASCAPSEPAPPAKPNTVTKTVVRDVDHSDRVATIFAVTGTLALGAAGGLYIAQSSTTDAAGKASTLDAHNSLADRASTERTSAIIAGVVGVGALGFAVYRWATHHDAKPPADVAVMPTIGGGAMAFTARW